MAGEELVCTRLARLVEGASCRWDSVVLLHDLTSVLLGIEESYGPTVCDSDGKDDYSSCR